MIEKINHIGIAVGSLEVSIPFYRDILKLEFKGIDEVPDQKVRVAMFKVGEVNIELLAPVSDDSPIAKFIEKKGEGMHHIAFQTIDIETEIKMLKEKEIQMIDETPRKGTQGTRIAFIHPKSANKVLIELTQE